MKKSFDLKTVDLVLIAVFTVFIAVCSWIVVPGVVPFTMQTFGVFLTVNVLGGKKGTISVLLYLLLGAIGVPVFSGFTGGIGALLGTTGGYLLGFFCISLAGWIAESLFGTKTVVTVIAMTIGLIACYLFGTLWFLTVYAKTTGAVGFWTALTWCVFPFVPFDLIKMILAIYLAKKLKPLLKQ